MLTFSYRRLDTANDAGELEITATAGGFSGRMSRFVPRALLLNFAEDIRATDHFWHDAEVAFTTLYPDIPRAAQPPARCTVRLSRQGRTGRVLVEVSLEDEVFLDAAARRTASVQIAFLTSAHALMAFTETVLGTAWHERIHAVIA